MILPGYDKWLMSLYEWPERPELEETEDNFEDEYDPDENTRMSTE